MTEQLSKLKAERNLISIRREEIDERRIQAFLLDYSKELILIQYVYDFILDGLMVLRRSDISEMQSDKTDLLQTKILKEEGLYSKIDFDIECSLDSWGSVLSTLSTRYRFITIEDESRDHPLFYLGKITLIGEASVSILGFSGAANWSDEESEIFYEDISCAQFGNNYVNVYERYFERKALTKPCS